jgi:predicted DNA binding CopG/RHH family protein
MMHENIPSTDSISELARFWDAHDITDFESELDVVDEPLFVAGQGHRIVLRLSDAEAEAVHAAAQARGVDEATVIREWIREHATKAAS